MFPENNKKVKKAVNTVLKADVEEVRPKQIDRGSPIDYFDILQNADTVTTEQINKFIEIPESELRKCRVGKFLEWGSFVILHKGHNRWRVLKT